MSAYRMKSWEELTIRDDYMFKLIMSRKRICKQMLERILHIEIADLSYLETEKSMSTRYQSKGIRLDVYVKDEQGTVYNIEMQVRKPEAEGLAKRTRYYQSMMDADLMEPGADYLALNQTIIIFICPFDPFDAGRYLYTFENVCQEDHEITLGDGTRKIFLNTKGTHGSIDDSIKAFLHYVDGVISDDLFVQEIDEEIRNIKIKGQERMGYMFFADRISEERQEAMQEGRAEGRTEGRAEGRAEGRTDERMSNIRQLIAKLKMSAEQAMDVLDVPMSERPRYRELLQTVQ